MLETVPQARRQTAPAENGSTEAALRELIAITGEPQAEAVEVAARERIARLRREQREELVRADVEARQRLTAGQPLSTGELDDESGLPA